MQELVTLFGEERDVQAIAAGVSAGMKEQMISGLSGSARQVFMASVVKQLERPLFVLAPNLYSAQKIAEDLAELLPPGQVLLYPANELIATESAVASPETLAQQIEVLTRLSEGYRGAIVAPVAGARRWLPAKEAVKQALFELETGGKLELEPFLHRMVELGYERAEQVEAKGQLSVRGGIIDFYPLTATYAYRVELFDDEIDSIRTFDVSDQRSIDAVKRVRVTPCMEVIADDRRIAAAAQHASELLELQLEKMTDRQAKKKLQDGIGAQLEALRQRQPFADLYQYVSLLYPERQTLFDYIPRDSVLVVDEALRLAETGKQLERDEAEWMTTLLAEGRSLPAFSLSKPLDSLLFRPPFPTLYMSLFLRQIPHTQPQNIVNFTCRAMQNFHGQMNVLKAEMERWRKAGARVLMLADGAERVQRVRRVLADYEIPEPTIMDGNLQNGFELPSAKLVIVTESEMFTQKQRKQQKKSNVKKLDNAERIKSYTDLRVGDYVVHVNHGIGRYVGIGTLVIGGIHKDYLHIVYSGGDKLSVPIDQIDLIQKYVGTEEKEPKVNKLGGSEWTKVKSKVRASVQDIADDLVKLYAERQAIKGFAFGRDSDYQREFESMFPYQETTDQLRAIQEIKKDMEKERPMDRLLCGDVGYGKTEVAIRAAFKAAYEGKQVAVLVPTTILAQQHYETFRERFSGFPFNIAVLSRFRSRKEQNDTIKGLKTGGIDVVIGTHRLLSKDMVFKDIGLLIVDEEQRFGVSHKEKLKRLRTTVDVLTLSATPIPRTLHMSMLGVRDLSVIETPPENRFPVQTYVVEHGPSLVREAIERELARDGQVYYLFNRVQGIYQMAEQISMLVPDARVAVAHGQMSEQELERTILEFLDGEHDVLVSTSIIETGVDIPNVNTLIVHDADKMGLSQLYQLRGRVGRSNRIAYAYFTYQRDKVLNEVAEKRLQSIKEFTELGSGFKIAMRDLAIRGAGNLLGAEQHGFIAGVGFDLYSQMLAEEIRKRKREVDGDEAAPEPLAPTTIELPIDAYLPSDYIYDSMQKIDIYKKVAAVQSVEETEDLLDEMIDRFGEPPEAVRNLLTVARLRVHGTWMGLETISLKGDDLVLTFHEKAAADGIALAHVAQTGDKQVELVQGPPMKVYIRCRKRPLADSVELCERFLLQYKEAVQSKGEELHNVAQ